MPEIKQLEQLSAQVPISMAGLRLDQILAQMFTQYSRARLQQLIKDQQVTVDGHCRRVKDKLRGGEQIRVNVQIEAQQSWQAEDIPLDILFEDNDILVVNKPVGLVVHPAPGNRDGTLVNALLHHFADLALLPRAGVVHRLDKDTSGLLVVAKTIYAQKSLVEQLQSRQVTREYLAIVQGILPAGRTIDAAISRHPVHRTRMAVVASGKTAITHFTVDRKYRAHCLLKVKLDTGRTHQIRVHMQHIHHPIVGDPVYGGRARIVSGCSKLLCDSLQAFKRQALHAHRLVIVHPQSHQTMQWTCPLAEDMVALCAQLELDCQHNE